MAIDFLILNKKITPYIYILFFSLFLNSLYGQTNYSYRLKMRSVDSIENSILKNIRYKNRFEKKEHLSKTKDSVINILKEEGYYTLLIDSIKQQQKTNTYFLKLGTKIKTTYIKVHSKDSEIFQALGFNIENGSILLKNKSLKLFLNSISNYLLENGQLFSKVKLKNFKVINQSLFTELQISTSKKRSINKTIVKGYANFPSAYINHYLNLNDKKLLNADKIEEVSKKINQLSFATEIKKPEILFSKDSTILYLYLKKKASNSFDGLINFSNENKKLNFKGYLDLNLVNIFNTGEEIKINWRNNSNNKQDVTLKAKIPYVFNSKISTAFSFNLYRNDSTFTNTNASILLSYPINRFTDFSFLLTSESSTLNSVATNISNYDKKMLGIGVQYNSLKSSEFSFDTSISYGTRNTHLKTNQYLIHLTTSGLIKTSNRTAIYIRSKNGLLFSDSYLENELFREGGANSIRGFNEQSIFTSKFSYLNSELRFISENRSYLYSIHDVGIFSLNNKNNILYSIGVGYNYIKNNNSIDVSYIYGSSNQAVSSLKSSFISVKLLTLF